jgi:hypothetical protein
MSIVMASPNLTIFSPSVQMNAEFRLHISSPAPRTILGNLDDLCRSISESGSS